MCHSADNNHNIFEFPYADYISAYSEALESLKAKNISLYRWAHNPMDEDDCLPQIFQGRDPRSVDDLTAPALDAPVEVQLSYINNFSLSHFISLESAVARFHELCKNRIKRTGSADSFIELAGSWIVKVVYTEDVARMDEPDKKGHVNVFPEKNIDIRDLTDPEFNPINMLDYEDAT